MRYAVSPLDSRIVDSQFSAREEVTAFSLAKLFGSLYVVDTVAFLTKYLNDNETWHWFLMM